MKVKYNALAGTAKHINLLNTVNGGITMTSVDLMQDDQGYTARFYNAAFDGDNYHVELNNRQLTVYTTINEEYYDVTEKGKVMIPSFIRTFPIPDHVDVDKIDAVFEEGALIITAPFREDMDGSVRKLNIRNL
ncbi:MAG: Hsp20/alpha crystallin family protein [Bacteroidota bacterium]